MSMNRIGREGHEVRHPLLGYQRGAGQLPACQPALGTQAHGRGRLDGAGRQHLQQARRRGRVALRRGAPSASAA